MIFSDLVSSDAMSLYCLKSPAQTSDMARVLGDRDLVKSPGFVNGETAA